MSEPEYIEFFEDLARKHRLIAHGPQHKAFFVVHDDNYSELELAIKNDLSLPALLLDQYYDDLDAEYDNNMLTIDGGFSVICSVEMGNVDSIRAARDQARQIARSFLARIRREFRLDADLRNRCITLSLTQKGAPTSVIGGGTASGWGYGFELRMPTTAAVQPGDWSDLQ